MKLRALKIETEFVPKWNGNRDLPLDEQIKIIFSRIPGTSEKNNYEDISFSSDGKMSISYKNQMLVSGFVKKIKNFTVEIGNEEKKIEDGVALSQLSLNMISELFDELRDYLFPRDEFNEGELKA